MSYIPPKLSDLYNPEGITEFLHKNGKLYGIGEKQGIQVYYKDKDEKQMSAIEIWQQLEDGRLMKVVGFYSKSIICTYKPESETV